MENNFKKGINPMATGLVGMVIGAGIGAAVTRVLTDKKTREMLTEGMNDAKDRILSYAHDIGRQAKKPERQLDTNT